MLPFFSRLIVILVLALLGAGCSRPKTQQAPGYIEGRYTYMATSVSGVLKALRVRRGESVKAGQLLFVLEAQPESDTYQAQIASLNESINARDAIIANLAYAKITYERYKILVPQHAIQQSQLDNAKSTYDATLAQLAQANATISASTASLAQARWTKDQKVVYAPTDSLVFDTYYRLGEYTQANQAILSLLAPGDIKAIFYVNQADLQYIHLRDRVSVACQGCEHAYPGFISFISPSAEYTPPVIFSNDTSDKLVYRIEAEFAPDVAFRLHPGQPVFVTYNSHE